MTGDKKSDHYNVGHFFVEYMSERPQDICQIDAATGKEETKASVLSRSIRMAKCLRKFGLKPGDVLALGGRNHLDVHIPFYAAQMNGLPIVGVDPFFKYAELKTLFKMAKPKIAFCQEDMYNEYIQVTRDLGLDTKVIPFDDGKNGFKTFMETYNDPTPESEFQVSIFDTQTVYCWLVSTSGTTGVPKVAAVRHPDILAAKDFFQIKPKDGELRTALNLSSMQWISACYFAMTLPVHYIKVQSSEPSTTENVIYMINKYKPALIMTTATAISPILKSKAHCDLTCFDFMVFGGSIIYEDFLMELRKRVKPDTKIVQGYGQTESLGAVLSQECDGPFGNCGKPKPSHQVKLVDPTTGKEITEPNVSGELWVKGTRMAEYYGNPEETAAVITEDGWLRTGDLLYRDENDYYFFVERIKMLLKYRNYQVIPPEVEEVIIAHDDVMSVCVTGIPDPDDGERVVACVMRCPGSKVTAQEIKDLVASSELRTALNLSSMQWISACYFAMTLPVHYIKVQSSEPSTTENVIYMINKYKPALIMTTATAISPILKSKAHCDLTCFDFMVFGGSIIYEDFLMELRKRVKPDTKIVQGYGQTESLGAVLSQECDGPFGNCGKPKPSHQVKLVDPTTGKEITEPNVSGELWVKGTRMAEYYGNPEETAAVITEDGWLRTGDLLYRDENDYYFFVERIKMLLKYRNYQVIPPEVEEVIIAHDDVMSVCVTGIPDPDDGERVVACVMRCPGSKVTAQEIKDLVASKLSVPKHLHGGVFFVDDMPLTSTGKVARHLIRQMALTATVE